MPGGPRSVVCPKCGAEVGKPCRTLTTKRVTDIHAPRFDAYWAKK